MINTDNLEGMSIHDINDEINDIMHRFVNSMERVDATKVGLDIRAGRLYVNKDCIISDYPRTLDYYGGFEYVDKQYVQCIGDYKVYLADDDRVRRHVNIFYDIPDEHDEEDVD